LATSTSLASVFDVRTIGIEVVYPDLRVTILL